MPGCFDYLQRSLIIFDIFFEWITLFIFKNSYTMYISSVNSTLSVERLVGRFTSLRAIQF